MIESEIRLKNAPNFRDLGGYLTADGREVRRGQIFRSEALNGLIDGDIDILSGLGLKLICDLRSEQECKRKPNTWPERFTPATMHMNITADLRASASILDVLRQDPSEHGATTLMMDVYRSIPDMLSVHVGTLFSVLIAANQLPLVFNCTAGKDRVGVFSAIILLALGVPRETVVEDYLKTNRYQDLSKLRAHLEKEYLAPLYAKEGPPEVVILALLEARESYLDAALTAMGEQNGRIDDYLRRAGVTGPQIESLQSRLLV